MQVVLLTPAAGAMGAELARETAGVAAATAVILSAEAGLPARQLLPLAFVLIGSRPLIGRPAISEAAARR